MDDKEILRTDILSTVDYYIENIKRQRKIMLGVSISAVLMAPFAIGLSLYLLSHPTFFFLLETENDFGDFLSILLSGIILVSIIWLITGIRQYKTLDRWNKRYDDYIKRKHELDDSISSEYNLDK